MTCPTRACRRARPPAPTRHTAGVSQALTARDSPPSPPTSAAPRSRRPCACCRRLAARPTRAAAGLAPADASGRARVGKGRGKREERRGKGGHGSRRRRAQAHLGRRVAATARVHRGRGSRRLPGCSLRRRRQCGRPSCRGRCGRGSGGRRHPGRRVAERSPRARRAASMRCRRRRRHGCSGGGCRTHRRRLRVRTRVRRLLPASLDCASGWSRSVAAAHWHRPLASVRARRRSM